MSNATRSELLIQPLNSTNSVCIYVRTSIYGTSMRHYRVRVCECRINRRSRYYRLEESNFRYFDPEFRLILSAEGEMKLSVIYRASGAILCYNLEILFPKWLQVKNVVLDQVGQHRVRL